MHGASPGLNVKLRCGEASIFRYRVQDRMSISKRGRADAQVTDYRGLARRLEGSLIQRRYGGEKERDSKERARFVLYHSPTLRHTNSPLPQYPSLGHHQCQSPQSWDSLQSHFPCNPKGMQKAQRCTGDRSSMVSWRTKPYTPGTVSRPCHLGGTGGDVDGRG